MNGDDIKQLMGMTVMREGTLRMYGPQGCLLIMLYKLNVLGMRRVSYSYAAMMVSGSNAQPPPCSIMLPVASLSAEYLQFCPRDKGDEEFRQR
jgi:hypothetical protein